MSSDDRPPAPAPPSGPPGGAAPTAFGPAVAHHAWRLSGRIVAGVGQLLLWLLTGVGTLLRPVGRRVAARLTSPSRQAAPGGDTATAPLPRWINLWGEVTGAWYFAPLTGFLLALAALAELVPRVPSPFGVAGALVVAATLPLVWRREYLRPVAAVALGAVAASLLTGQPLLVTTTLAAFYTLYALGRELPRQSTGILAVGSVVTVVVVYVATATLDEIPWPAAIVAVLAAIGLGDARTVVESAGRTQAAAQERNNETLTRLSVAQREQAVMRERARIARELHDVVAHSVSMIAVQAETAPYTMDALSPQAREGYAEIARTAREALVEMRRLLSVLRADARPDQSDSSPQPRLDRLPELIDQHRGAGGRVEMDVRGDPRALSTTVELSAYRIVQEALTNARRHAPGAEVHVDLVYLPDRLAVRVRDDGAAAPTTVLNPGAVPSRTGGADATVTLPDGRTRVEPGPGGHGLVGMRERATMLGGRFSAGPAAHGGFQVEAELPLTRRENPAREPGSEVPPR
ncbi:sensor histidine kinase [Actinomadura flavalba]|uniref:sensor histidine kinase n=1 Tax=Actinomadura flavalba TaxID=1120938 RepID=UPI0003681C28|nr:sensor histidine kinase [Actinomadura flavalba]